ncbi:DUF4132 domain-containing protein [Actinomadura rugatobispora]|uniref:DUF4132 domain-containing protein n=1 Tax=Actinomadura rugatobispora TaxID=1994 RepID=A0ABW0ZXR4_9ACTN|nr:hypothetical protein GCM10010200_037930 [Actinomadura rugatobispora]
MSDHGSPFHDEDVLATPKSWPAALIPRRGGRISVPEAVPDGEAIAGLRESLEAVRPLVREVLERPSRDQDAAEAGLAYLRGDATPLGAAVVASVEAMERGQSRFTTDAAWADLLAADHGLAFAACAFAEIDGIWIEGDGPSALKEQPHHVGGCAWRTVAYWAASPAGRRMRALLAASGDGAYAEAARALEGHRREPLQRVVVSFLVPTRTDWVDECCAEPPERETYYTSHGATLLWHSLSTAGQVEALGDWAVLEQSECTPELVFTLVDGLGEAAAPVLARSLDGDAEPKGRKLVLDALSRLPGDEAFRLMGGCLDKVNGLPAMEAMIERFPARALRVLPELSTGTSKRAVMAAGLLRAHLAARPGLAAQMIPKLEGDARAAIEAVRAAVVPEAPEDRVPKALRTGGKKGAPDWARPEAMPQVLLRGREHALPVAATGHLIEALSKASPGRAPTKGVREAFDALDPGSLAEFGWNLYERWRVSGESTRIAWAQAQLSWTGDDETARRLGGLARSWPGQNGIQLPLKALDVLAAIGTDVAVMQLHMVSEKARPKRLKKKAGQLLVRVADDRGLTMEQLGDRIVPDFGLDADGGMTLDYGPRRFTVGFDEQLKPVVFDGRGTLRKTLPKPGAKDDPEAAPAAHRAFTGLKKDVRMVAADQIRRLERAMAEQRRWTVEDFRRLFVGHPLLWHIVRRLVWLHDDGGAGDGMAFRVAEDRSFADVDDKAVALPETGEVRIAHPVHLGASVAAWAEVLADYEVVQPFPQLGRPVDAFTEEERAGNRLSRVADVEVGVGRVLGLERHGWERGTPQDAGIQHCMTWEVAGRTVVLDVSPGFPVMSPGEWAEQTLGNVWIGESEAAHGHETKATFGELDDVTASELLLTLRTLADSAL